MLSFRCFVTASILAFAFNTQISHADYEKQYCLALRGNGELAPAHWGGLAQVVERLGLPQAMAGGSSASISLFLLESIAQNPLVEKSSQSQQKLRASLLLKSLESYLDVIAHKAEWLELAALAEYLKGQAGGQNQEFMEWLKEMIQSNPEKLGDLVMANFERIQSSLKIAMDYGLFNPETFMPLIQALGDVKEAPSESEKAKALARLNFYAGEIYQSVVLLGKFNAETDNNLFFRSGLVSFPQLGHSFGKVGNFYAGREMPSALLAKMEEWMSLCIPLSRGKTWIEMAMAEPKCDQDFRKLVVAYETAGLPKTLPSREEDLVSQKIATFPTTAVLRASAYEAAKKAMAEYPISLNPAFGENFSVNPLDVRFGYWGKPADLERVQQAFKKQKSIDAKSARFYSLGATKWATVMGLSPAEPGLAPLQEFAANGEKLYSAGGWSDLHPVKVLKAHGCKSVIYVTRRGGESLFGQGVAKRLFGFSEVPWERLSTGEKMKAINVVRNNQGNPDDQTSLWSRLYNLANPSSSFNLAIQNVDAVLCTDWNRFNITDKGAIDEMITEAYRAPWAIRNIAGEMGQKAIQEGWRIALPKDNAVDPALGFRPYAGCLPF